jgi:hypothetical protein
MIGNACPVSSVREIARLGSAFPLDVRANTWSPGLIPISAPRNQIYRNRDQIRARSRFFPNIIYMLSVAVLVPLRAVPNSCPCIYLGHDSRLRL